jgi:spermidine synthase
MKKVFLYIIVFISGGAVLAIEILGTRILGPFYGVSIFLWSALISITLIALSIGYVIGGWLADKGPDIRTLGLVIAVAGLWVLIIPLIRGGIISAAEPLGLRAAVLIVSFILFAPPLTLLGMVSPYAIRLKATAIQEVGRTAGNLYAFSTIGSVIAALLTGFILIPNVGVNMLVLSIGIILIIVAAIGIIKGRRLIEKAIILSAFVIIALVSYSIIPIEKAEPESGLLMIKQSPYGEIRVVDFKDSRFLLIDGGIHTSVDAVTFENNYNYAWVLDIPKNMFDYIGDMLLIGLGGGSVLKSYYLDGWDIDAVEIDPAITETAYNYFGLNPDWGNILHMDGRRFLKEISKKYDLIILDAFGSSSIPFHLVTAEAFVLAASRLNEEGILAINIEAVGWDDIIVNSITTTLKTSFKFVKALPIAEPPNRLGNLILLASNRPLELKEELDRDYSNPDFRYGAGYQRVHAWDNSFIPETKNFSILTDDLNPVDIWSERINLAARKELHEYFGQSPMQEK